MWTDLKHVIPSLALLVAASSGAHGQIDESAPPPPPSDVIVAEPVVEAPVPVRPDSAARVVKRIDFESAATDPLPIPDGWVRGQDDPEVRDRPGFPLWNEAETYRSDDAAQGEWAVRLPTRGGSTSLMLLPGSIPVFAGADYLVSASIRTDGLRHATGSMVARFLDAAGEPIDGAEFASERVRTAGVWEIAAIEVLGDYPDARFLQLELLLEQPAAEVTPDGPRWREDFSGSVSFDDVLVMQMPRVEVGTAYPGNVIPGNARPEIDLRVRDLAGESLRVRMDVYDHLGVAIDAWERDLGGGRLAARWSPRLNKLGWYRVVVSVLRERTVVARTGTDLAWILATDSADAPVGAGSLAGRDAEYARLKSAVPDRARFGITASSLDPTIAGALTPIASRLGVGSVELPLFDPADTAASIPERWAWLDPLLDALTDDWQTITLGVSGVPIEIADRLGIAPHQTTSLLIGDETTWWPYVGAVLDRYGQSISRWRFGPLDPATVGMVEDDIDAISATRNALARLVPGPKIITPWHEFRVPDTRAPADAASLYISEDTPRAGIAQLAESWRSAHAQDPPHAGGLTVQIGPISPDHVGIASALDEFIKRAVLAWRAFGPTSAPDDNAAMSISVVDPWRRKGERRPLLVPKPELAAWRNLIDQLAVREVVDELDLAEGVRCLLLAPRPGAPSDRGGSIILWAENPVTPDPDVEIFLGTGNARMIDIFGNATPIAATSTDDGIPVHRVAATPTPAFIEGIDVDLVRLVGSLRIEPDGLISGSGEQERTIIFTNPWDRPIEGRLLVVEPGGYTLGPGSIDRSWRITPRVVRFAAGPGEESRTPVAISFSPFEESGPKPFAIDLEFARSVDIDRIRLTRSVDLGHPDVELFVSARHGPGPDDVTVDVEVINRGEDTLTVELTTRSQGAPLQRSSIGGIRAGESASRAFLYPNAAEALAGTRVRVSLAVPSLDVRLNQSAKVP